MNSLKTKFDINLFENTDLDFLNDLPNLHEKLSQKIDLLSQKKDELSGILTNQNNINIEKITDINSYFDFTKNLLESIYNKILDFSKLKNELNNIEKNVVLLIETLNTFSSADDAEERSNDINIDELLTKPINKFKTKFSKIENEADKCINEVDNFIKTCTVSLLRSENDINSLKPERLKNLCDKNTDENNISNFKNLKDNNVLKISERNQKIVLPYTAEEIKKYLKAYPEIYKTPEDVILGQFTLNISLYSKNPILTRFREAYYLYRTKEMKSIFESFIFAKNLMFRGDLNPVIIAAVKSKKQLDEYLECMKKNNLDNFRYFKVEFDVVPL